MVVTVKTSRGTFSGKTLTSAVRKSRKTQPGQKSREPQPGQGRPKTILRREQQRKMIGLEPLLPVRVRKTVPIKEGQKVEVRETLPSGEQRTFVGQVSQGKILAVRTVTKEEQYQKAIEQSRRFLRPIKEPEPEQGRLETILQREQQRTNLLTSQISQEQLQSLSIIGVTEPKTKIQEIKLKAQEMKLATLAQLRGGGKTIEEFFVKPIRPILKYLQASRREFLMTEEQVKASLLPLSDRQKILEEQFKKDPELTSTFVASGLLIGSSVPVVREVISSVIPPVITIPPAVELGGLILDPKTRFSEERFEKQGELITTIGILNIGKIVEKIGETRTQIREFGETVRDTKASKQFFALEQSLRETGRKFRPRRLAEVFDIKTGERISPEPSGQLTLQGTELTVEQVAEARAELNPNLIFEMQPKIDTGLEIGFRVEKGKFPTEAYLKGQTRLIEPKIRALETTGEISEVGVYEGDIFLRKTEPTFDVSKVEQVRTEPGKFDVPVEIEVKTEGKGSFEFDLMSSGTEPAPKIVEPTTKASKQPRVKAVEVETTNIGETIPFRLIEEKTFLIEEPTPMKPLKPIRGLLEKPETKFIGIFDIRRSFDKPIKPREDIFTREDIVIGQEEKGKVDILPGIKDYPIRDFVFDDTQEPREDTKPKIDTIRDIKIDQKIVVDEITEPEFEYDFPPPPIIDFGDEPKPPEPEPIDDSFEIKGKRIPGLKLIGFGVRKKGKVPKQRLTFASTLTQEVFNIPLVTPKSKRKTKLFTGFEFR